MSTKKLLAAVAVCMFLGVSGFYIFSRLGRHFPPNKNPNSGPIIGSASPSSTPSTPQPPPPATPPGKKESLAAPPGFLLREGETLEYDANVAKLNSTIANLKIVAAGKSGKPGKAEWHLQAFAHTENPYRMVFQVDDRFDSYSDAGTMTSVQYEMHLNERGQTVDNVERMLASSEAPPPGTSGVRVLPGTRDPLGMLEYLRSVDWSRTPEVHSPVFDGRKLYDVRAVLAAKSAAVKVPAGNFDTSKIELHVLDNGAESKDAHFVLYLANDASRLPVLLEAVLPVATARVELTKTN